LTAILGTQLLYLGPLLAWMAVVALLSTELGSASRTTDPAIRLIGRLLLRGQVRPEIHVLLTMVLRKSAHVFEYAVLAFLACRWLQFSFPVSGPTLAAGGTVFAGICASVDEWHQASVSSRSGLIWDVLVDLAGAAIGAALFAATMGRGVG
jgi:VanZ family protein